MSPALPMLVPLASGFGYAVAALMLKRGSEGAGPWRVTFIVNCVIAVVFSIGWLFPAAHPISLSNVGHAAISGALFFVGQIFTFLALSRGDVSVATPVLGSKVVFVALFTLLFGLEKLSGSIWIAVLLTAAATALLGGGGGSSSQRAVLFRSLLYGFAAAGTFALTDITQQRWIREWSLMPYMATLFFTMALLSFGLVPIFRGDGHRMTATNWRWLAGGATLISVQASGVAWGIVHLGATTTNVLYNSRGVWSVVLVWVVGHWFGNEESARGSRVMFRRLAGALLLLSAILLLTRS
jgi:drug/metabolite transporter (DMT)-like permease